jgi:hypothetical protein
VACRGTRHRRHDDAGTKNFFDKMVRADVVKGSICAGPIRWRS